MNARSRHCEIRSPCYGHNCRRCRPMSSSSCRANWRRSSLQTGAHILLPRLAAFAHSARTLVRELPLALIPQLACLFPCLEQKPDPLHRPPLRWRAFLFAHLILRQACLILKPRLVHRAMMMRVPIVPARPARTGVALLAVIAQCTYVVIDALRLRHLICCALAELLPESRHLLSVRSTHSRSTTHPINSSEVVDSIAGLQGVLEDGPDP